MSDIREKAIYGTFWSFIETFGNTGLQFIIGIILARLLLPEDYGIIGVLAIFLGIAGVLVDGGFRISIIRSNDLTKVDLSTIFYVNLAVSLLISLVLFGSAQAIANLFNKPELFRITRLFSLIPLLNGFGLVQTAIMFKNLEFKRNAKLAISANLISGIVAVYLAYRNPSFWALAWKSILQVTIYNVLIWSTSKWYPQLIFSFSVLKKHFNFSSKLLLTGFIDSFFNNLYSFIFGKFFSFRDLGFFTKGRGYVDLATKTLSIAIQKVSTPILAASDQDNEIKIQTYLKLLRYTALLIFPIAILLIVIAEPMIIFLIGEKWRPAVPYLQLLAIPGMIYPLLNANSSLFEVLGRSDLILKSAVISRSVQITILLITINFTPIIVTGGIVLHYLIIMFVSFHFIMKAANQKAQNTLKIIILPLIVSVSMGVMVYIIGLFLDPFFSPGIKFLVQTILGLTIITVLYYLLKVRELIILHNDIISNGLKLFKSGH